MEEVKVLLQAIGVLIVPFVSVLAAQQYGLWKETKQEAMRLFTKIILDCSEFRIAFVNFLIEDAHLKSGRTPKSMPDQLDKRNAAYDQWHLYIAKLRADAFATKLVFDKRSKKLDDALTDLALLNYYDIHVAEFEEREIKPRLELIELEMQELWKSFSSWTATDWNP